MTIQEVENKYGKIQKDDDIKKWYIEIFHGKWFKNSRNEFCNSLNRYYEILKELKAYGDTLIDTYLINNEIWIKANTKFGQEYDKSMRNFAKFTIVRNKLDNIIKENGHKLLSSYIDKDTPILIDFNCGHPSHYVDPDNYIQGHNKCRYCTHERTLKFQDDIYTLRPDLIKYFENEDETIGLAVRSSKKVNCKCPICGEKKIYTVNQLSLNGFSCNNCRDGKSYPEKLMYNILKDLDIQFETEVHFDWCNYQINGKNYYGYYDIVIESMNIIIEMDGALHYKESNFGPLNIIQEKDKYKNILAECHGYKIYRIDCNYDSQRIKYEYTKDSILRTLSNVFDFSNLDWDDLNRRSDKPLLIEMCDMWNNGYATNYICKTLNISNSTLIEYLNRGNKIGICSYTKEESNDRSLYFKSIKYNKYIKAIKDGKLIGVFWDVNIFCKKYVEKYNIPISRSTINAVIRGQCKSSIDGIIFQIITKEEYASLLSTIGIITDDGVGNNEECLVRVFPEYLKSA